MAECSYARCAQQRRNIRRDLQRWTRNMVHIVGLERIAEELMGRRKWKLYQDSMSRSYLQPLNNNVKRSNQEDKEYLSKEKASVVEATADAEAAIPKSLQKGGGSPLAEEPRVSDQSQKENEDGREPDKEKDKEEVDGSKDWKPQTKCYFCVDGKLDSEHAAHGVLSPHQTDSETSESDNDSVAPSLTSGAGFLNNNSNNNNNNHHQRVLPPHMATIESIAMAVAAFSGAGSPGTPPTHVPFYSPNVLSHNWYLANVARAFPGGAAGGTQEAETKGEQPLDLSKGSSSSPEQPKLGNNVHVRLPQLDTRHIFNSDSRAKPRMSAVAGRRTYTEDELQAALRDIQSGKLGTRRAAVIYGIPRSTLRNKVYKLALERERESHINSSALKLDEDEGMDDDKELSGAEEEKEVEKALEAPLLSEADAEALKHIFRRGKEGEPMGLEHSEVGPYIQNFILATQNLMALQKQADMPEFLKRLMAEEQLLKMQQLQQPHNGDSEKISRPSPSNSVGARADKKSESDMDTEESSSNVILKIPSFKPTSSKNGCDLYRGLEAGIVSPPVTSESGSPPILPTKGLIIKDVKDVIAQSISQKFQAVDRRPIIDMDIKRGFTPPLGGISVIKQQEVRPYQQQPPQQQQQQQAKPNTAPSGGKGTRPKRGKYRNYDRDSLVEAVRAVQRGEMSVHRAGSYYGVPHSTLEYKVKERHLMRPRKRDPKPNPVDEKIASLKQNDLRNQDKLKPVLKAPPKFPPTSPNGIKLPMFEQHAMPPLQGYSPQPFPFWTPTPFPLEYGRNPSASFPGSPDFFASQMIQKLQEESNRLGAAAPNTPALHKSARQMAESLLEGHGSNGSFLDGIIRSSLESGVPEEKGSREERNLAPEKMSNKALLDQLCRNSRLAPLSKSASNEVSGDETFRKSSPGVLGNNTQTHEEASPVREDVHTIELSNDSVESGGKKEEERKTTPPRIYLKQDLVNPDNLKPEMLVRFRDVLEVERNGTSEAAAASENESQD